MIGSISTPAGIPQSPLIGRSKTLVNNSVNNLFTFPLASGEIESVCIAMNVIAKKGTDWAMQMFIYNSVYYNDGTILQKLDGALGDQMSNETKNNAGTMAMNFATSAYSSSLSGGVVTYSFNPGNVGTTPDSIVMKYIVLQPTGKTITFL